MSFLGLNIFAGLEAEEEGEEVTLITVRGGSASGREEAEEFSRRGAEKKKKKEEEDDECDGKQAGASRGKKEARERIAELTKVFATAVEEEEAVEVTRPEKIRAGGERARRKGIVCKCTCYLRELRTESVCPCILQCSADIEVR